jgi:hypothetical protein
MVTYYLLDRVGSDAKFIDRYQLSGDAFENCSEGAVRLKFGNLMPYAYWFSHESECGVARPDVVYEVGTPRLTGLTDYVLVYQTPPEQLVAESELLPGRPVSAAQFVAVRPDLAPLLSR